MHANRPYCAFRHHPKECNDSYCPQRAACAAVSPFAVPTHSQAVSLPVALRRSPAVRAERRPTLRVLQTANESHMRKATADPALAYRAGFPSPDKGGGLDVELAMPPHLTEVSSNEERGEFELDACRTRGMRARPGGRHTTAPEGFR
ncbi:unnamed protein product [Pleuronectes platessa]|uniref:Uncharacterized protein n=1 Tax=Pleuronectes platessa TaxID=8262 RepID=A0A9N7UIA2_PLEPL|nr:unnamed protein product [Pleuronectes platessa]